MLYPYLDIKRIQYNARQRKEITFDLLIQSNNRQL